MTIVRTLALLIALLLPTSLFADGILNGGSAGVPGQLPGTSTNDNASAGNVGEYIASDVPSGSAVSLTTTAPINVTSISLTAGDWNVSFVPHFKGAASTVVTYLQGSISTTTGTPGTADDSISTAYFGSPTPFGTVFDMTTSVHNYRVSLSTTTTIYAVAAAGFNTSTLTAFGKLFARRVR